MILSFGWTTPALLAGAKTVTRRDWKPEHAARFKAGSLVDAWNSLPRNVSKNPHKVAVIRIVREPYLEMTRQIPASDWDAEGFEYLSSRGLDINGVTPEKMWAEWIRHGNETRLYVVRFEVVELLEVPS